MATTVFNSTIGQELLIRVRSTGYTREADVLRFEELLESDDVDGGFALAALQTLADRELPHFNNDYGSASLELQLRAIAAALAVVRSTVAKISHSSHKALQSSAGKLDELCSRNLRLHDNPNVEFLMRKIKKDILALVSDRTKTDIALDVGLAIGGAALRLYGRDLIGAIDALQSSSLEWNQAWDAFCAVAQSFRENTPALGSASSQNADEIVSKTMAAYNSTQTQRLVNGGSEMFAGRGSLIAFQLLDAFQQQYGSTRDTSLVGPSCEVASTYLNDKNTRHALRFKALELLRRLGEQGEAKSIREQAKISLGQNSYNGLSSAVSTKIAHDLFMFERVRSDNLMRMTGALDKLSVMPNINNAVPTESNMKHVYADGSIYIGAMREGKYHGNGAVVRPNGERRAGIFQNGFMEGQGEVDYANGNRREGLFRGGRHCSGVLVLPSKQRQEGDFDVNGKLTRGTITSSDGDARTGTFVDGKLSGDGEHVFPSGQRRKGIFKDGFLHGEGRVWYENGDYREGSFMGGRHRNGKLFLSNKNQYDGEFDSRGKLVKGTITFTNGAVQTGTFVDHMLTGEGVYVFASGQRREGYFKGGFLHGTGKVSYENGDRREGRFEGGRQQEGLLIRADGFRFQGNFNINGKLEGQGVMILPDGSECRGYFSDGIKMEE